MQIRIGRVQITRGEKEMLKAIMFLVFGASVFPYVWAEENAPAITVYNNASCGCCENWIAYIKNEGFDVQQELVENVRPYKEQHGVPKELSSCHTAVVGGYVIEGHVPASDIRQLLNDRPDIRGLSVPVMTTGAPGMPQGGKQDGFNVMAIRKDGSTFVYSSHKAD
jgi:hypothetical protein